MCIRDSLNALYNFLQNNNSIYLPAQAVYRSLHCLTTTAPTTPPPPTTTTAPATDPATTITTAPATTTAAKTTTATTATTAVSTWKTPFTEWPAGTGVVLVTEQPFVITS
jgi:hypothetical protein